MKKNTIFAWLGTTDINAAKNNDPKGYGLGPIANALALEAFDEIVLLWNQQESDYDLYIHWLSERVEIELNGYYTPLQDPTNYREIWNKTTERVDQYRSESDTHTQLTFHTSPGTPQMQTIWVLMAKTRYNARLIQTQQNIKKIIVPEIPFNIEAELLPEALAHTDAKIKAALGEIPKEGAEFGDILYLDQRMAQVISDAKRAAVRNLPILINGESGTGKELLARAIWKESHLKDKPFKVINCGAIPKDLIESELFGYAAGAFTGASKKKDGMFHAANGGTLFLDELGELPLDAQVKLLRVVQDGVFTRVGGTTEEKVTVRLIAATHRNLQDQVASGDFREDLFYRLAIAVLELPPLRDRGKDLAHLIKKLFESVMADFYGNSEKHIKSLSPGAKKVLLEHSWPGNVRELQNTLKRMLLWSDNDKISEKEARKSLFSTISSTSKNEGILNQDLSSPVDLNAILQRVEKHYLQRALDESNQNKSQAARLLGLGSATSFNNYLKRNNLF